MKVLITGGTGLIGRALSSKLLSNGYDVAVLSRKKNRGSDIQTYTWDPKKNEIESGAVETADYIVHLAGANLSDKRWTKERKQVIVDSRVETANFLYERVSEVKKKPRAFISASAVNYYGTLTSEIIFSEADPPANDFLGQTCRKWEQSAEKFKKLGIRTVIIRNGAVLSEIGGALPKMILPVKFGVGAPLGNGKQFMPWIHIDDISNIYIKAIADAKMHGAYNGVAPDYKNNRDFMRTLAKVHEKPFWAPNAPANILKLVFGQMSSIVLEGSRISCERIRAAGYNFLFPDLENALADLVGKRASRRQSPPDA
jgi:uncharacterized protein